ncbi:TGL1 Sterol esterase TGL1 [Candida maltosa Xu316]|uniref:Triglyceride lipase-cholesterol esterase n=1 Tax=Candida maltosa (strain Xu316) TaxID=1245528 RepID=M3K8D5_CANMX|nr:Triglyceride lipase-cholesterol esterase [Candida maltosa Xu316]
MTIPVVGRLRLSDWPFIFVSFTLAWFEFIVSIITTFLPTTLIDFCTFLTKQIYRFTTNPITLITKTKKIDINDEENIKYSYIKSELTNRFTKKNYDLMIELLNSENIDQMVSLFGYEIETRIVKTEDDYLLTIHRIRGKDRPSNGKVVYLHHGLLMCSEIWVTMIDKYQNLPFILYDLGYDVWLGNNRGNKYSQKHLHYDLNSIKYWDFSIDEFALFDIPNTIDYILKETGNQKLTYIGFSQGSAQAFASVSVNSDLTDKIDQLIAISPATTPHGLYSKVLDILLKSSPNVVFLLFSRRVLMPSCLLWERIMYPPLYDSMIDISNYLLFNWKSKNITKLQKLSSYAHLYSTTSVKCVVHWFQVMSSKNFQMYHDSNSSFSGLNPISYPLKNIKVPIHLIYGTTDSLVDIEVMKNQLPKNTTTTYPVHNHEHLDNLWGDDVYEAVFKPVLNLLGEDVDRVYARLFRQNENTRLIENIIRSDETIVVEDEDGEILSNQSYLKAVNKNPEDQLPASSVNEYERQQTIGGNIFV